VSDRSPTFYVNSMPMRIMESLASLTFRCDLFAYGMPSSACAP
jgi:hypothetical protein